MDGDGAIYFLRVCQVLKVRPGAQSAVWAGSTCGDAYRKEPTLRFGHFYGSMKWGPDGNLYVTDGRTVRKVAPDGTVSTLSGQIVALFADPQTGEQTFHQATGVAIDGQGSVYIADSGNRRIVKVTRAGEMSQVASSGWLWSPSGIAVVQGDVYVVENLQPAPRFLADLLGSPRVRKISSDGGVETLARATGAKIRATLTHESAVNPKRLGGIVEPRSTPLAGVQQQR